MLKQLDSLIADIRNRVRAKDPTALERAVQLSEQYSDVPEVWRLRSFAHNMNKDMNGGIIAMTEVMDVAPSEPVTFFGRGRYEHNQGNLEAALADFNQGIELSKQLQDEHYLEHLYFWRADVFVKLGRKADALADLEHVGDGFVDVMPEKRTKFDILADCGVPRRLWRAMSDPLESLLDEIELRVHDDAATALERATQLTEQYPNEPDAWHTLAYVRAMNRDIDGAIATVNRMMDIPPPHPAIFYIRAHFIRGYYERRRGNLEVALADFDKAIAFADPVQDESRLEDLHFRRAEVLVKLGRKAEARADLAHVRDGFAERTIDICTKADILADCEG